MTLPEREVAERWVGKTVVDSSGRRVGACSELFADRDTGASEWLGVDVEGGGHVYVPALDARQDGDDVRISFTYDQVAGAPVTDAGDELTEDQEQELYRHFGVRTSSEASTSVLPVEAEARAATGGGSSDVEDRATDRADATAGTTAAAAGTLAAGTSTASTRDSSDAGSAPLSSSTSSTSSSPSSSSPGPLSSGGVSSVGPVSSTSPTASTPASVHEAAPVPPVPPVPPLPPVPPVPLPPPGPCWARTGPARPTTARLLRARAAAPVLSRSVRM